MLAEPRAERQAQWGLKAQPPTAASSPGEDLPPFPSVLQDLSRIQTLPEDEQLRTDSTGFYHQSPQHFTKGPTRISTILGMGTGGIGMEKQASASGTVAGIEWVDWYDCYKRYKEAKIRAEAEARTTEARASGSPRDRTSPNSPVTAEGQKPNPREIDLGSNFDTSSSIGLTPTTSRDETIGHQGGPRKRSMSIRSTLSLIDPQLSPTQKRTSVLDRPRQASGSYTRSTASSSSGSKKKKNLVNKMEGWWNAVKSNFIQEGQHYSFRPSNLGPQASHRVPSAPQSRRGSKISPTIAPQTAFLAPEPLRRDSSQSLRQATSHADLRSRGEQFDAHSLQEAASIVASTSADLGRISRGSSMELDAHYMHSAQPEADLEETLRPLNPPASGLEARRGHPSLRLELESNVLTRPGSRMAGTSGSSGQGGIHSAPVESARSFRPTESSSRSSSYGQPFAGPGLTPGVPKWDQTPSPIFALGSESRSVKEDKPVAPGADITVASVRRHVRHRLNAAKETCDSTLKKAIAAITKFAEEQDVGERDDAPQDYFDAISDSPVLDAEYSDNEAGDRDTGMRSRAGTFSGVDLGQLKLICLDSLVVLSNAQPQSFSFTIIKPGEYESHEADHSSTRQSQQSAQTA